jgi:hypothetical protein
MFAGNLLDWSDAIRAEGVVTAPYDAAITGPAKVSQAEQVKAIGVAAGEEIYFEELTPEQAREQWLRDGCPEEFADWRIELLAVSVDGPGSSHRPTPSSDHGRPPRTFAQWALDHASEFRPPARMGEAVCQRVTW